MNIWFDMDGTIADLYGVDNWLEDIENGKVNPYVVAKPLLNMNSLAKKLNSLVRKGHSVNVVSWTSKSGTKEYDSKVEKAKREWLRRHLRSVRFDKVDIVPFGTPKHEGRNGILFDDNATIRSEWGAGAYDVNNIFDVLNTIKE